jgi:hypothetical protein
LSRVLEEFQPILFHEQQVRQSFCQGFSLGMVVGTVFQGRKTGKSGGFGDFN